MTNIVIIGQNESLSIEPMLESLEKFFNGSHRIWVLDRCSDDSEKKLERYKEEYHFTPSNLLGRQTSFARNYGLMFSNPKADVIFLDGDRFIIQGGTLNIGRDDISLFTIENDYRKILIDKYNTEVYGTVNNMFYSCGLFIKRRAIKKIQDFQKGELFSTEVQDKWGIEDLYLGDVCYHLGLKCNIHKTIELAGGFSGCSTPIEMVKRRFMLRDKLNVRW